MAETQPWMLQALCYTADEFRESLGDLVCGEGVVDVHGGDLLVASSGAADHSVTVAAGSAYVFNDENTGETQMYRVLNDASVTIQLPAGGGGDPRVDTIVATVSDSQYPAGTDTWVLTSVDGTPNAAAALTDAGITASAAAVPDNSVVLAYVLVAGADTLTTTISAGNILDARNNYLKCGSAPWVSLTASAATSSGNATFTQTTLATLTHRDRAYFSVSGSTITVLQDGLYDINAMVGFASISSAGTQRIGRVFRNNTNLPNASPDGTVVAAGRASHDSGEAASSIEWTPSRQNIALAANDTLKMATFQDTGGAANTSHSADFVAHLTVRKVG